MIRKLRMRFIALSMAALFFALALTLGLVNLLGRNRTEAQYGAVLEAILDNGGRLPDRIPDRDNRISLRELPELLHEFRYFSSVLREDGTVEEGDLSHIAAVDREGAREVTRLAAGTQREKGLVNRGKSWYSFSLRKEAAGVRYAFLDVTSRLWLVREVFDYSLPVCGAILLIFFLFIFGYSKKVIAPYVVSMEKQQQFVTNAGHELKTPLSIISANTEMLETLGGGNKWTASTLRQVKRMNDLVARLMTLARMEESRPEELVTVDLSRVAAEEAEAFENMVTLSGKTFEKDLELHVLVRGDEKSLREMCSILLDNAAKYCDGGGRVRIELKNGRHPALTVRNSYSKADSVDTSRFFERFYRADGSRNSQKQGYGIGLSIASDIARRMGARIQVSARGGEIAFTLSMRGAEPERDGIGSP